MLTRAAGLARARSVTPLAGDGQPSATGKYVLLAVGVSGTTQAFCSRNSTEPCDPWTFTGQALADPRIAHDALAIVNGAITGKSARSWESPKAQNYARIRGLHLTPKGLTEAQVQTVWLDQRSATREVALPAPEAEAFDLEMRLGNIVRTLKLRYPNLQIVYLSNPIYTGYAQRPENPEPFAYESGFAAKWLIEAQIAQMAGAPPDAIAGDLDYNTVAPWLAWGPELWADGETPRSDGLRWLCEDFDDGGLHPSMSGEEKVASLLLDFMHSSEFAAPWFSVGGSAVAAAVVPAMPARGLLVLALALLGSGLALQAWATRACIRHKTPPLSRAHATNANDSRAK